MIKKTIEMHKGPVVVLASKKQANFRAVHWKDFGVVGSDGLNNGILKRKYRYPFSISLRKKLFELMLPDDVPVHFIATSHFRSYLSNAADKNEKGHIHLVVGQKEVKEGRYDRYLNDFPKHLKLMPIPMQNDGISATSVREAVSHGDHDHLKSLYHMLDENVLDLIVDRMFFEWSRVDRKILEVVPKAKDAEAFKDLEK